MKTAIAKAERIISLSFKIPEARRAARTGFPWRVLLRGGSPYGTNFAPIETGNTLTASRNHDGVLSPPCAGAPRALLEPARPLCLASKRRRPLRASSPLGKWNRKGTGPAFHGGGKQSRAGFLRRHAAAGSTEKDRRSRAGPGKGLGRTASSKRAPAYAGALARSASPSGGMAVQSPLV